jgi:hypothetical protein
MVDNMTLVAALASFINGLHDAVVAVLTMVLHLREVFPDVSQVLSTAYSIVVPDHPCKLLVLSTLLATDTSFFLETQVPGELLWCDLL